MSFSETEAGADAAEYQIGTNHVATGLPVTVTIVSNNVNGTISEADAEQIILDISQIIGSDTRFQGAWATRTRTAKDSWTPPVP